VGLYLDEAALDLGEKFEKLYTTKRKKKHEEIFVNFHRENFRRKNGNLNILSLIIWL
jgi:hypothetical protein